MKEDDSTEEAQRVSPTLVPVRFELNPPTAISVSVSGTCNHVRHETEAMPPAGGGCWLTQTSLLPVNYEYRFRMDGPTGKERAPNPFGGKNSVLRAAKTPDAKHRADAKNLPFKNAYKKKA